MQQTGNSILPTKLLRQEWFKEQPSHYSCFEQLKRLGLIIAPSFRGSTVMRHCPALTVPGELTCICDILLFPEFYICTMSCFCSELFSLPSLLPWPGALLCAGCERILRCGSPRENGQHTQVENPKQLVCFSLWMKLLKVTSTGTGANRLDLLARAWEWHMQSEQICFCLYPYARTDAKFGVFVHVCPLNNSCPVALHSKALQPAAGEICTPC